MGISQFDERRPWSQRAIVDNSAGVGLTTVALASFGMARIDVLLAVSNDIIDHVVEVHFGTSAGDAVIGSFTLPAGRGTDGTKAMDVLAECSPATLVSLPLDEGEELDVLMQVAVTIGQTITVTSVGGR